MGGNREGRKSHGENSVPTNESFSRRGRNIKLESCDWLLINFVPARISKSSSSLLGLTNSTPLTTRLSNNGVSRSTGTMLSVNSASERARERKGTSIGRIGFPKLQQKRALQVQNQPTRGIIVSARGHPVCCKTLLLAMLSTARKPPPIVRPGQNPQLSGPRFHSPANA